jgi:hypothetical protein
MSALSEVSLLMGQRAGELEKAKEVFTSEIRAFVSGLLSAIRRVRAEPWSTSHVRIDLPREIETEQRSTAFLSGHYAIARADLRFKRGTNFMVVADVRFGVEYDEAADAFCWMVNLTPAAKYQRIDDLVWAHWQSTGGHDALPGSIHQARTNTVRFSLRPFDAQLTSESAFTDIKAVLEFVMTAEAAIGRAVGLEISPNEDPAA